MQNLRTRSRRGKIDCIPESFPDRESDEYDQGLTDMKIKILAIFE